jgi:phospholipid/cholesterol/gamma-HCH transport system substrate-binding protein
VHTTMKIKPLSRRNPALIGLLGAALTAAIVLGALQYKKLPFFDSGKEYSAYFAEAGGLRSGAAVQVAGFRVGEVTGIRLDGPRVLINFKLANDIRLGERSEAEVRTKSLLGAKILEVIPRGEGHLSGTIPIERTKSAYQLPDALGDLASTINALNTDQLNQSLSTLAEAFKDTPADVQMAVAGVTRFSQTLNERDADLRALLENANKSTAVLAQRSEQVVGLVTDTNALLAQLRTQSAAVDQISGNLSALGRQLSGFVGDNREQLRPALDKLNGALTIVDRHKDQLQQVLKMLNAYLMSLGESVAAGPFFKAYLANLLPGQFVQPFVDAAFSDLGLDPNVLLPSQLHDPQTGQPGTPALPVPYPRTGQGGEPNLTLPDAITGKPGDQGCGPAGLPLPGPTGCYPYRAPLPAPPPGGPPPGPPAAVTPPPTPAPVYVPAPGEAPPPPATEGAGQ